MTGRQLVSMSLLALAAVSGSGRGQILLPVSPPDSSARSLVTSGSTNFLVSERTAYSADGSVLVRLDDGTTVRTVVLAPNRTLVLTRNGPHSGPVRVVGIPLPSLPDDRVTCAAALGDDLWLGTPTGAFRIGEGQVERLSDQDMGVNAIVPTAIGVYLATSRGAWFWSKGAARLITDDATYASNILEVGGVVWITTPTQLLRVNGSGVEVVVPELSEVLSIVECEGAFWIGTRDGSWRIADGKPEPIQVVPGRLLQVCRVADALWVITDQGIWQWAETPRSIFSKPVRVALADGPVVWVATAEGIYRATTAAVRPITVSGIEGRDLSADASGSPRPLLATNRGFFRIHPDGSLDATAEVAGTLWLAATAAITGDVSWPNTGTRIVARYEGAVPAPFSSAPLAVAVATDADSLQAAVKESRFDSGVGLLDRLPYGPTHLHIAIRDPIGNLHITTLRGTVVRGFPVLIAWLLFVWLCLVLLTLAFAKKSRVCHAILMNRWIRDWGSFGVIPALLRVPRIRHQLLSHYISTLKAEGGLRSALQYAVPDGRFELDSVLARWDEKPRFAIIGHAGMGKTAFMRNIHARVAIKADPERPIPVFLPVKDFGGSPRLAFIAALRFYGDLTDSKLCLRLLKRHKFYLFIDDWDEIGVEGRSRVERFIEREARHNVVILAADPANPPSDFDRLHLPHPDVNLAERIVCSRLRPDHYTHAKRLVQAAGASVRLPACLAAMTSIIETEAAELPAAPRLYDLHQIICSQTLDVVDRVAPGWGMVLAAKVFKGIANEDLEGVEALRDLPDEIAEPLEDSLWVSAERLTHPLICASLAARHLALEWKKTLPALPWKSTVLKPLVRMLVMDLAPLQGPLAVRTAVMAILESDAKFGEELLEWLAAEAPGLRKMVLSASVM